MNNKVGLLLSALLVLFFVISGLLDVLDDVIVKTILFVGFSGIIVNIILIKSKKQS